VGLFDYNNDGLPDIYFVNGAPLRGATETIAPPNRLYRNDGNFRFTDVTHKAGVGNTEYGYGCVAGDYDNDGDVDLYVVNWGPNALYENHGDGTFVDVAIEAGVNDPRQGAAAAFVDYDKDGDLDLYVANYLVIDLDKHKICYQDETPVYCNQMDYEFEQDALYRNNGDGTFTDISEQAGITGRSTGMSVICADYNNDGWSDIFVANDAQANYLYVNNQDGTFEESALYMGCAYDANGNTQGNMGVDAGDYNQDGWLDIVTTTYERQMVTLYQNTEGLLFESASRETGLALPSLLEVTWGTGLIDFDNDTDLDLFVACGHLQDTVSRYDPAQSYKQKNQLYEYEDGKYTLKKDEAGPGLKIQKSSRGSAFGDLDNDGDIDIVINNARDQADLLRNETQTGNNWLIIDTIGSQSNRDGIGARVELELEGRTFIQEVSAGGSYASMNDSRLHFGLGSHQSVDQITVKWPSGHIDILRNIDANQILTVEEGRMDKASR